MLDLVMVDGRARGIIVRNLVNGKLERYAGHAVVLATGGYGNVFYLSTMAKASNATAIWRAHKKGALFGNSCFTQIHPTCIPVGGTYQSKLTLMVEFHGTTGESGSQRNREMRHPEQIPEEERRLLPRAIVPIIWKPRPACGFTPRRKCATRDLACGTTKMAVYLDFAGAIKQNGKQWIEEKYGNLFDMYHEITDEDPYTTIYVGSTLPSTTPWEASGSITIS
jgi:succinate dehydrogenase / fumarate reductase flavoprotein subunit